jgi:tRNA threonylcarbamoyladenosine biosynthesis protein TsaE
VTTRQPASATDQIRRTASAEETERLGAFLAPALRAGDVVILSGPLGSGKTRFVAGLATGLGWRGRVRSPSFTLVHEYGSEPPLAHVDLYRLDEAQADGLGLEEHLERGLLVVEWGERLPRRLTGDALWLTFEVVSGSERDIAARATGTRGAALLADWHRLARAAGERRSAE